MNKKQIPALIILVFVAILGLGFWMLSKNAGGGSTINLADGITRKYEVRGAPFSLTHPKMIVAYPIDSLPWGGQLPRNSDTTGNIVTYGLQGRRMSMNEPYIQVAYVSKAVFNFPNPAAALDWVEKSATQSTETRFFKTRAVQKTRNGREVLCDEFYWGQRKWGEGSIAGKFVAYGYLDFNEKYLLAFALTANNEEDYKNLLKDHNYIIQSFQ